MIYRILADVTLALHFAFIVFVVAGALLVLWRRWMIWLHLPAALWGVSISMVGWVCPLTPIENHFRRLGGQAGYTEGFIEHYLVPLVYPGGLTQSHFVAVGIGLAALNLTIYGWVYRRVHRSA